MNLVKIFKNQNNRRAVKFALYFKEYMSTVIIFSPRQTISEGFMEWAAHLFPGRTLEQKAAEKDANIK